MIIAGLSGAALAFIPLEGRPLDRWFFAFIKSIYQPTMFYWKKSDSTPAVFTYTQPKGLDTGPSVDYAPIRQARVNEFIHTVAPTQQVTGVTDEEAAAASNVLALFSSPDLPTLSSEPIGSISPKTITLNTPPAATPAPVGDQSMGHIIEMNVESPAGSSVAPAPSAQPTAQAQPVGVIQQGTTLGYADKTGVTADHLPTPQPPAAVAVFDANMQAMTPSTPNPTRAGIVKPAPALTDFPFPNKPTSPNMVAGMVVTIDNKLIENAIVTILRTADQTPIRAMKTNALGQFAVVTPLESGSYLMIIEKDGYHFDNYSLVINNQVVEPVLLKANSR